MEQTNPASGMEPGTPHSSLSPVSGLAEMLIVILLVIIFGVAGSQVAQLIAQISGYDLETLLKILPDENTLQHRNLVRLANLAVHLMSFTIPCILLALFVARRKWYQYLSLQINPGMRIIMLAALLILVSMPFTSFTYWVNMQIPLPEWAQSIEADATQMINALLTMEGPYELLLNLLIIALVPAIGEELLFRGVFQKALSSTFKNEHVAIWFTAFFFSVMHMQFEGFIPRFLLGAILGYLFSWSRSLWVPIAAHFFFNGIQVLLKYLVGDLIDSFDAGTTENPGWLIGMISLGLTIGLALYIKRSLTEQEA
jgi:hypothetical protein